MVALLLAAAGCRILYLGTEVPPAQVAGLVKDLSVRAVAVSVSQANRSEGMAAQVALLRELMPRRVTLLVGGEGLQGRDPVSKSFRTLLRWTPGDAVWSPLDERSTAMPHSRVAVAVSLIVIAVAGCTRTPETPREQLAARNLSYSEATFLASAEKGDLVAVNLFLAAGMSPNVKDQYGGTALRYAASKGHLDVVQALLDKGADINVKDVDDFTPLRYAAYYGHADVVRLLLDRGADVNAKDRWGGTPLTVAAGSGHFDILQMLKAAAAKE